MKNIEKLKYAKHLVEIAFNDPDLPTDEQRALNDAMCLIDRVRIKMEVKLEQGVKA